MPLDVATHQCLKLDEPVAAEVNGRKNGVHNDPVWDHAYHPCPEAFPDDAVPPGHVTKFADWSETDVYKGTVRDLWVYTPPNLKPDTNPAAMFFNDGAWYLSRNGPVRATNVLDSLHHSGEMAPTIAIFIMPGNPDHKVPAPIESYDDRSAQRSLEYDAMTARYGEFLFNDVLPFVERTLNLKVSTQPHHRTTCGISSGGIAAFNVAWQFPDQCQRVLSHCGSFTDIWGGHNFPSLIRKTPRKPIRAFLQSGERDANTPFGDWALANQTMASALQFAGYDYKFEFGTGGHNLCHGGAIFADSLRWLWRG